TIAATYAGSAGLTVADLLLADEFDSAASDSGGSTDQGGSAFGGQRVEGALHHAANVGVDVVNVGVLAELGDNIDGCQHLRDDLGRQRQIDREHRRQAERKAQRHRQDLEQQRTV